ncbi:non-ribosomal peptide synthetase [Chitinophaga eiseniae]|uniref:non-ribosomal peptide synthetase n=1 Tax=Chitinophaga eiseniae TaxID=634771 RepID=UPI0013566EE3|nr:non-ribosomal peptide synthetase [Chitinophaga eiseniae]
MSDILSEKGLLEDKGITFIESGSHEYFVSYRELFARALSALYYLQQKGISPGDELVLQIEDNSAFLTIFWACILGGIIPVPLTIGQNDEHKQKLFNVWSVLNNPSLAIAADDLEKVRLYAGKNQQDALFGKMRQNSLFVKDILQEHVAGKIFPAREEDLAFIQFSSGSTGKPKGVRLTHGNLIANINAISTMAGYHENDATLSWMPLTHDMGLIGFHLNPLCIGMQQYLMPTNTFVRRPALWMEKATTHRVTILCSPNFGYEYLLKHAAISDRWDLSTVRILYNGAEPISHLLYEDFIRRLAAAGLPATAVRPVYGLAEASLAVTMSETATPAKTMTIDSRFMGRGERVMVKQPGEEYAITQVDVGKPVPECLVRIANEDNIPVPELMVHEIQISGRNVTRGYYNNTFATDQLITADGWLKTGDLGYLWNDHLYVTGRAKDVLFINGKNFYSHDIEQVAGEVDGISLNKIVVAGHFNHLAQKETAVAFVFHRGALSQFLPLADALKRHVNSRLGIVLDRVIPVQHIPRTTSGKLQRFSLTELLLQGAFDDVEKELASMMTNGRTADGPLTATEALLVDIWKDVLQQEHIGIHDNFFETGGNSLRAIEAAMKISAVFSQAFPVHLLFEKKTIAALAAVVQTGSEAPPVRDIPPAAGQRAFTPVAPVQKTLYYNWERDKDAVAYNIPVAVEITGNITADRLQACFRLLLQRHEVLRMSFHMQDQPVMQVHEEVPFFLAAVSCDPAELHTLVQPFDLHQAPLCRAQLVTTPASRQLLFLDFHHIIADGISISLFIDELFTLYTGGDLRPLKVCYRDYAEWQLNAVDTDQRSWWRQVLSGTLPVLDLPADYQRPAVFLQEGEKLRFNLGPGMVQSLRQLARKADCTLQVLLFFIYKILLQKYTRQQDIVIGVPVAGRNHLDLLALQGMFVNNLCIRNPLDPEDHFLHGLKKEQAQLLQAMKRQDVPFGEILQLADGVRDPGRHPVFDTMFVYQNMPQPRSNYGDLTIRMYPFDPRISKFDLTLEMFEENEHLRYNLEYATSIFSRETILTFSRHLEALMANVVADPFCRIADLRLADAVHQYTAITREDYPRDKTADELFALQAAATPHAIALEYRGACYSYEAINRRSDAVAHRLQQEGISTGAIVALIFHRSPEFIIALLGVLKAGAAYVPVDPELPDERISFILRDCRTGHVLTTDDLCGRTYYSPDVKILTGIYSEETGPRPVMAHTPEDLAYVIYTSGTTGHPKGAMISHRSLVNYATWAIRSYLPNGPAAMPLYTAISFDLTITAIFPPLLSGNKIVVYEDQPGALVLEQILKDNKVEVVKITPSHLRLLRDDRLKALIGETCRIKAFVIGGESLETWLAKDIHRIFSGRAALYNEYGPTETTVGCMIHRFDPAEEWLTVPIGIPAANTSTYLLDEQLKHVPVGLTGEIYIAGDGVGKGYLHNEQLTARRFIDDPFEPGRRMYKTGDLARRLPEGKLLFLGRTDRQVKINGYRIEPAEIEQQLLGYMGMMEAVVDITPAAAGQPLLVAYYKTAPGATVSASQLKNYLAARLPYYMVPAYFHLVNEIPLTVNGKVDTARLILPQPEIPAEKKEPANAMVTLVLEIWRTVLQSPGMQADDNFFAYGGDSVKAIQIVSKLSAHGIYIKVKDLLTYHTVEQICLHLPAATTNIVHEQGAMSGEKGPTPIESWFFAHRFPHPEYYNQSVLLQLQRPLGPTDLQQAFNRLLVHHDGLRLNYNPDSGLLFYNSHHLDETFALTVFNTDVAGLTAVCEQVRGGFDLQHGLLIRGALIHLQDGRNMLFITAHHLVVDGVTWRVLLEDLYLLLNDAAATLPLKTASLAEWSKCLAPQFPALTASLPEENRLADCKVADSSHHTLKIDAAVTAAFSRNAWQLYKADISVLLCAALVKALAEGAGRRALVIEQEHHGRDLADIDVSRTAGWFTTMYPLVVRDTGIELPLLIRTMQEEMRLAAGTLTAQQLTEPADIRYNYLGDFTRDLHNDLFTYANLPTGREVHGDNPITVQLELNAMVVHGELLIDLTYHTKIIPEGTVRTCMLLLEQQIKLLAVAADEGENAPAPSDFDCVDLTQEELDILF